MNAESKTDVRIVAIYTGKGWLHLLTLPHGKDSGNPLVRGTVVACCDKSPWKFYKSVQKLPEQVVIGLYERYGNLYEIWRRRSLQPVLENSIRAAAAVRGDKLPPKLERLAEQHAQNQEHLPLEYAP